jgi:hypothetical protein
VTARALKEASVPTLLLSNSECQVTVLSPWRLVDYWKWTQEPALDDFELA